MIILLQAYALISTGVRIICTSQVRPGFCMNDVFWEIHASYSPKMTNAHETQRRGLLPQILAVVTPGNKSGIEKSQKCHYDQALD